MKVVRFVHLGGLCLVALQVLGPRSVHSTSRTKNSVNPSRASASGTESSPWIFPGSLIRASRNATTKRRSPSACAP